ncbi:hypothetical protein L3Q82_006358 [Scortum barcoo]|uniref:Uncharacterized protein n=1 Tax=Scortum barcoo TaxID=214431 RepID=A0ACB8X013_9TELE|nr:hypothetical protein L3Q82_006358 [Scortum barcoo]
MQKATVQGMESRERQKAGQNKFDSVKIKLSRIQEEMENLWAVLTDSEQQLEVREKQELKKESSPTENTIPNYQKQRQDTDVSMKITQQETEMKDDMQRQKQDIEKKLAQVQSERDEIERLKTKMQRERENIERDRQLAKAEMDAMKCMRENTERQNQELDDKLHRIKKEIREMEVMESEMEIKKKDLVKMIRIYRRKREETIRKEETEHTREDTEERKFKTEGQRSEQVLEMNMKEQSDEQIKLQENQFAGNNLESDSLTKVNTDMQRVILEVEEIKKMLQRV